MGVGERWRFVSWMARGKGGKGGKGGKVLSSYDFLGLAAAVEIVGACYGSSNSPSRE